MKISEADFQVLVDQAMRDSNFFHMRPVIEKELLHYDILYCLDQVQMLDDLVFQGGTALRLCYGGNRFSEDLDFAGGVDFNRDQLTQLKSCIEGYIGKRYGLEVCVKEPPELKKDPAYAEINVDKWQISIVTFPARKDVPRQKIKIEIANIPAYSKAAQALTKNYDFLPDGYEDTIIFVETLEEIMADKIIAFPATEKYIRYRDIWDIAWIIKQGAQLNTELVVKKINDYRLTNYQEQLNNRIKLLPEIIESLAFKNEMQRFLPTEVFQRTLGKEKYMIYLRDTCLKQFKYLNSLLYS